MVMTVLLVGEETISSGGGGGIVPLRQPKTSWPLK